MGFISILGRGLRAIFGKPRSYSTGEKFERYSRKYIFTQNNFKLLQKTHPYRNTRANYVPSADPDFKFLDLNKGKVFFVEAKYRASFFKGQVNWCTDKQLSSYNRRSLEYPVFILLGVGGTPERPAFLSLIPLQQAQYNILFQRHLEKYSISPRRQVRSKILWRR
jgi:hypothetical protein